MELLRFQMTQSITRVHQDDMYDEYNEYDDSSLFIIIMMNMILYINPKIGY